MRFKNANLDQIITPEIFARNFFCYKKCAETSSFIVLFDKQCLKKANLDQIITPQKAKLGPENNSTAYIYIYIHICASGLVAGPEIDHFYELISGPVVTSKTHGSAERSTSRVNKRAGEELTAGPVKHG